MQTWEYILLGVVLLMGCHWAFGEKAADAVFEWTLGAAFYAAVACAALALVWVIFDFADTTVKMRRSADRRSQVVAQAPVVPPRTGAETRADIARLAGDRCDAASDQAFLTAYRIAYLRAMANDSRAAITEPIILEGILIVAPRDC